MFAYLYRTGLLICRSICKSVDITPPTIDALSQNPDPTAVEPNQNVTVTVEVSDEGTGVREVILSYGIDEGQTWINTTMNNIEANTYVQYKIMVYDNANNPAVEDKDGNYYVYTIVPEFQRLIFLIFMITTLIVLILTKKEKQPRPFF